MSTPTTPFHPKARLLHWLMAPLVIAMLFIGIGMLSTTSSAYALLLAIHKPLGATILVLLLLRIAVRLRHRPPPLPADLPARQRRAALGSHWLLYALLLLMPLSGWAMLSAAGYPVTLLAGIRLPPIAPHDAALFAWLRGAHHWLALLLFATFLLHLAAALFHGLVRRDGVLASMAPWLRRRGGHEGNPAAPAE
jgi:cytochrome b561